jgi:hypothetical protein
MTAFYVSDWELPKPGGPGPRIYIPQEEVGPVLPPATGFSFRRLLRLAGLRWLFEPGSSSIQSVYLYLAALSRLRSGFGRVH